MVDEESDVQLKCIVDKQNVSWHIARQNNLPYTVIDSSPLLNLANISKAESGHYQCAVNVSGEVIESNWATVMVHGKFALRVQYSY